MNIVYLSLGSNLGDRAGNLRRARELLGTERDLKIKKRSSIYETEPVGGPPQDYFLNQVIEVETEFSPRNVLRILQKIERQLGRKREINPVRDKTSAHLAGNQWFSFGEAADGRQRPPISNGVKWGPRLIDLDILLFDNLVLKELDLEIPHPRLAERKFVLLPLAEINPEFYHPVLKNRIKDLLNRVKDNKGIRLYSEGN